RVVRAHVELLALCRLEALELAGVDVGGDDFCAFGDERFRDGAPDALPRRRHQRHLAFQSSGHAYLPCGEMIKGMRFLPPLPVPPPQGQGYRIWLSTAMRKASSQPARLILRRMEAGSG